MVRTVSDSGTHGSPLRGMLVAGALSLVAFASIGSVAAGAAKPARAVTARSLSISETGHLHLTSHRGLTLNEQGTVTGTIKGSIYIHLTVSSGNRVSAAVNIYPKGGSLTGHGSAGYHVVGAYAVFSGTMSVSRGSGKYAHAHASALRFSGTIQRKTDAVTVRVSGKLAV